MNKTTVFNSPYLLGFDHLERLLERTAKSANDGYPPYNIEEIATARFRITLAVAGFTQSELDVTIEDNQLIIRGKQTESADRTFLHRGIAARQFQRTFVLADGVEVSGAELANGLLSINLSRPAVESRTRRIDIKLGGAVETGHAKGGQS